MKPLSVGLLTLLSLVTVTSPLGAADALARLEENHLKAVRATIQSLAKLRKDLPRTGPYKEYRANLHVHSAFSHDSRGTLEEIVAAAKRAGTEILLFTEHPAPHYDFFKDGHQGIRDQVLLIPGAEMNGMLVYPTESVKGAQGMTTQDVSTLVQRKGGLTFLSHLEERMKLEVPDLTGVEIYNIHALFKDQKKLVSSIKNPLWLAKTGPLINQYPQESYSALHEYPANYLDRWDELCQRRPHTGVSANDAHQNVGMKIKRTEGNRARIESSLEEKLLEVDAGLLGAFFPLPKETKTGTEIFRMQLDGYEYALRHAATHLLMKNQTKEATWDALKNGRAFVAFDWMANSRGFALQIKQGEKCWEMGEKTPWVEGLNLVGKAPLEGHWKILRNGKKIMETNGSDLKMPITAPGVYRAEVWLNIVGESRIWILSNPIYIAKE